MADKEQGTGEEITVQHEDSFGIDETPSAWQGDLPPEDDFHDEPESLVEEPEVSEDADTVDVAAAAKKRGTMIALGAVAGGAFLVAVLVILQFVSAPDSATSMAVPASSVMEAKMGGQDATKNKKTRESSLDQSVSPTSAETDMASIYNAGLSQTVSTNATVAIPGGSPKALETPTSVASSEIVGLTAPKASQASGTAAPAPASAPSSTSQPQAVSAKTAAVAPASVDSAPVLPVKPQQSGAVPTAASAVSPIALAAPVSEDRLKDLSVQIEELKKLVAQTAQQASALATKIDQQKPQMDGTAAFEGRLSRLESQISALASAKAPRGVTVQEKPVAETMIEDLSVPQPKAERVKTSAPVAKKIAKKAPKAAKAKKSSWVLRAATPDAAWVADDAGSSELRQVRVGESLAGIGRVKAIKQSGDAWVVVGTKGTIR